MATNMINYNHTEMRNVRDTKEPLRDTKEPKEM